MLPHTDAPSGLERRNVRALTLDTAAQGLVAAGINVFVAVYLVRLGAPNTLVGFLASAPAFGAIFLSIPAGAFLEGRKDLVRVVNVNRAFIRSAYLAIAIVPFAFVGVNAIWPVVILWTLTSIPAAVANPAWTAVVARIIPPHRRPRVNGNRWAILSVITAVGGAGFGWMLDRVSTPLNFQIVFIVSFLGGLLSIYFFGLIRMPDDAQRSPSGDLDGGSSAGRFRGPDSAMTTTRVTSKATGHVARFLPVGEIVRMSRHYPDFARFTIAAFVYRIGLNLPVALYSIYAVREAHASNTIIGLQSTAGNLALVASYLLWGQVAARRGHRIVLLAATAGLSFYPFATSLVSNAVWLIPATLIWGAFASGIDVSFFEGLLRTCPPERLQTFIAVNSAVANVVIFFAPIAGTLLADLVGIRAALVGAGAISLVGSALFYFLNVAKERTTTPGPPAIAPRRTA